MTAGHGVRTLGGLVTAAAMAWPAVLAAQCRIDLVDAGVREYRALDLEEAEARLEEALDANSGSPCGAVDARALTYLGATHWLANRPDEAKASFARAVVRAPRFHPDAVEFPPEVTDLFDLIRRTTPATAVTMPAEVEIAPGSGATLPIHLTASTDHTVAVTLRSRSDGVSRTLFEGDLVAGARGQMLRWDGRGVTGDVEPGRYDLEVVSRDSTSTPVRKVVVPITVEADQAEAEERSRQARAAVATGAMEATPGRRSAWKATGVAGAGLLAGALVVAVPPALGAGGDAGIRYGVAAGLGLGGLVGFLHFMGPNDDPPIPGPVAGPELPDPPDPPTTLRIRSGHEHRVELSQNHAVARDAADAPRGDS